MVDHRKQQITGKTVNRTIVALGSKIIYNFTYVCSIVYGKIFEVENFHDCRKTHIHMFVVAKTFTVAIDIAPPKTICGTNFHCHQHYKNNDSSLPSMISHIQ